MKCRISHCCRATPLIVTWRVSNEQKKSIDGKGNAKWEEQVKKIIPDNNLMMSRSNTNCSSEWKNGKKIRFDNRKLNFAIDGILCKQQKVNDWNVMLSCQWKTIKFFHFFSLSLFSFSSCVTTRCHTVHQADVEAYPKSNKFL